MGHKGPVKDLRAKGPKLLETIHCSILFYHAGLLPLILFVAGFSPLPESQSLNTSAIVDMFLKGNSEDKDRSGNRHEERKNSINVSLTYVGCKNVNLICSLGIRSRCIFLEIW
jgi:hypothetical protein